MAKELNKDLNHALKKEAKRNSPTLPVRVSSEVASSSPITTPWGHGEVTVNINMDGQGNQLAFGTQGDVHQQAINSGASPDGLIDLVNKLREIAPQLQLDEEDAAEYQQAVERIERESQADKPNKGRLVRALTSVKLFLEQGGGEAVGGLSQIVAAAIQSFGT